MIKRLLATAVILPMLAGASCTPRPDEPLVVRGPEIPVSDRLPCPPLVRPQASVLSELETGLLLQSWYFQYRDCSGRHARNLEIMRKAWSWD